MRRGGSAGRGAGRDFEVRHAALRDCVGPPGGLGSEQGAGHARAQ